MRTAEHAACVAIETSLFAHGMPPPDNFRLAHDVANAVRSVGAEPRFVAIEEGRPVCWPDPAPLEAVCKGGWQWHKATVADLPWLAARKANAATTVATTALLAHRAGLSVMATGGIGGVHRGFATVPDVSADLSVLARVPIVVVCSGVKTLLDVRATFEVLETLGVPVIGYRTRELPGFYTPHTGIRLRCAAESVDELVEIWHAYHQLGLTAAMLVVQPPPPEYAIAPQLVGRWTELALREASDSGVEGGELTPFVLARMAELSGRRTLQTNYALVVANAHLAAEIAARLQASARS